jgi:hypothetical protein
MSEADYEFLSVAVSSLSLFGFLLFFVVLFIMIFFFFLSSLFQGPGITQCPNCKAVCLVESGGTCSVCLSLFSHFLQVSTSSFVLSFS